MQVHAEYDSVLQRIAVNKIVGADGSLRKLEGPDVERFVESAFLAACEYMDQEEDIKRNGGN